MGAFEYNKFLKLLDTHEKLYGSDFPNIPYEYERSTQGLLELDMPRGFYENIFYNNAKKLFNISDS